MELTRRPSTPANPDTGKTEDFIDAESLHAIISFQDAGGHRHPYSSIR